MGQRRWGLGPVFAFEWLSRSRRWQGYAVRSLFVGLILAGLWLVYRSATASRPITTASQLAEAGSTFFGTMIAIELSLVLLVAPAATAGAVCVDKARGTLAHVLITDLTDPEIILGKLAARLIPVLTLIACAWPVAALGTLLGGIDPLALIGSVLVATGLAILGCALALAFSVWLGKTHEVLTVTFAIWALWLLPLPLLSINAGGVGPHDFFRFTHPFWVVMAPYWVPTRATILTPIAFCGACLLVAGGLAILAVLRVRPVYLKQANRVPRPIREGRFRRLLLYRRLLPNPPLDLNPVLWREWHRNRPSRITRIVWWTFFGATGAFSLYASFMILTAPLGTGLSREMAAILNAVQGTLGLLLLSTSTATTLSEERARGSLDVVLATPLSTAAIVGGKWLGAARAVPALAIFPTLIALSLLTHQPFGWRWLMVAFIPTLILVQGAALVSLGLALATWLKRAGRAVAWTIATVVVSVVGWPIFGFLSLGNVNSQNYGPMILQAILVLGSPFYNSAMPTVMLEQVNGGFNDVQGTAFIVASAFWCVAYGVIAVILALATLATFNRCFERTPEGGVLPQPAARHRPIKSKAGVRELGERQVDRELVA